MSKSIKELRAELYAAERAEDERMRLEIDSWSQDQLLEAAEECDAEEGPSHCWRCKAYELFNRREAEAASVKPGADPLVPGSSFHDAAIDIKVGDYLRWESRPGFRGSWGETYVVVSRAISKDGGSTVRLGFQRTNTDEPIVYAEYRRDEDLDRFRPTRRTEED